MMQSSSSVNPRFPPALVLTIGIAAVSSASTLIRLSQGFADSLAIAAWRLSFASLMLAPFAVFFCRKELLELSRRDWLLILLSGAFLAAHFAFWIYSLALTSVAASVVLVTTSPLFVALGSCFLLREKIGRNAAVGIA
ncbi:MAG: hypothetical protein CVT47_02430, partial [Thermoplasmata archaeon HGW-Thermoplasmata-2]